MLVVLVAGTGGTGATGALAFTSSGIRSGGGSCRFWLFPPVDAAVCELLPVCDGVFPGASRGLLFLSTAPFSRLTLAEPLRCNGDCVACFVSP